MAVRSAPPAAPARALPNLAEVVAQAGLPRKARILELGCGSAGQKLLSPIVSTYDGPLFVVDVEADSLPPRAIRAGSDPFSAELPGDIDLCFAMSSLVRMPDVIEGLLYDGIHGALKPGGLAVVPFPRDVADATLIAQGVTLSRVRTGLQAFLGHHFGAQVLNDPAQLQKKFERCRDFEFVAVAARSKRTFATDPIVWLVVRKRAGAPAGGERAFPRSPRSDQFQLAELETFVSSLKDAGVAFLPVDKFAERYAAYCELRPTARQKLEATCGHLKFDIHGNLRRALDIATMLGKHAVPGLFLMMHRHPLNQEFYDSPSTWQMLRDIQAMGHEIGIHADPFCLIRESNNFHMGLKKALTDLRERGFPVRAMTLHGDTREHIKARQLQANDFFQERYRRSKWDGLPPEGEEILAKHVHRYSYRKMAVKLGIEFFSEVNFLRDGRLVSREAMLYLSDNTRMIRINSIPKSISPHEQLSSKTPFVIDAGFIRDATEVLRKRPFLALFHPQWYW